MDKDTRFDDTVGSPAKIELDDLQIDEEKNVQVKFGEVNLNSIKVTKHTVQWSCFCYKSISLFFPI